MRELLDGQSVEVQGSASRPYVLKNVGGVFSCSCPGWRFQSLPIERRTCRHLRDLRGEAAEEERVGVILSSPKPLKALVKPPPLLLAESWDGELDPKGYFMSEKLDGVRAYWDGKQIPVAPRQSLSRAGLVHGRIAPGTAGRRVVDRSQEVPAHGQHRSPSR